MSDKNIENELRLTNTELNRRIALLEEELQKKERTEAKHKRLIMAVEQTGEAIVMTDIRGMIQFVNPAFERMTGYSRKEVVGQNMRILKSGEQDEQFYRNLWNTISNGKTWVGRMVNKRKDGILYTEGMTISPVCDASNRIIHYVAIKRDVTESLRLAAQFQKAQKMEYVSELAGSVAHDFNNMIGVIMGYTELVLNKIEPAAQPERAYLEEILKATKRSIDIIQKLLAFARRQSITPRVIDLNEIVDNMLRMLRRLIGEDIDLEWIPEANLWRINIDPAQVDQILANLLINARDAIAGVGKITIETSKITLDETYCANHAGFTPGEFVMLAISDDGCGMDKESLKKVFEPFFTTKGERQGIGLGLATVYGIVKQNNGFINVYSEPGEGTTFKIYLPRHAADEAVDTLKGPAVETLQSRGETVLVAEDEILILQLTGKVLEELGYTVLLANTPGKAIRLAKEHTGEIHLIVVDVIMPEMNGRDLVKQIQSIYPNLKVLFMSGYTASVIARRGLLDEPTLFLQKPFSKKELAEKARMALGKEITKEGSDS